MVFKSNCEHVFPILTVYAAMLPDICQKIVVTAELMHSIYYGDSLWPGLKNEAIAKVPLYCIILIDRSWQL